ncbi:MAG TPA: hypothetical protein VFD32_12255 [Dehalococcoidia bacterium]|nr:hypothetical protein [Dehalococcoidia bacterium]
MAAYPALVQLVRLLGRAEALTALGVETEPDPAMVSVEQRARLAELLEARLERVSAQLVDEAAASDDVTNRAAGMAFVDDRIAAFVDLLCGDQPERLRAAAARLLEGWER